MKKYTAYNLHTHSFYCGHGSGTLDEYCIAAISQNLELLGFSEHLPLPDRRFQSSRMDNSMMTIYEKDALEMDAKYQNLKVLLAYECDYSREYYNYYRDLLDSKRVNYLITGTHFIKDKDGRYSSIFTNPMDEYGLKQYAKTVIDAMESNLFSFVAHPDLFLSAYQGKKDESLAVIKDIIALSKEKNIPLEINGNGMLKKKINGHYQYPCDEFWYMVEDQKAPTVRNTDSHSPNSIELSLRLIKEYVKDFSLNWVYPCLDKNNLTFEC